MLRVDLGDLERRQTLRVEGLIEADGDLFEGSEFVYQEPLNVVLNATWAGSGELVVRGGVVGTVVQDCRRCLDRVEQRVDLDIMLLFAPSDLLEEDDSETHRLEIGVREIDLGPYVRDEVVLAIPSFVGMPGRLSRSMRWMWRESERIRMQVFAGRHGPTVGCAPRTREQVSWADGGTKEENFEAAQA